MLTINLQPPQGIKTHGANRSIAVVQLTIDFNQKH